MLILNCKSMICNCVSSSRPTTNPEESLDKSPNKTFPSAEDSSEDYDPHDHGKQQHPTLFWGSVIHLFKCIVGTGVLVLPYAFKNVGYGIAIFGTLLVGFIYIHVMHLLVDVEYRLCKKLRTPNLTYAQIVQHTFERGPRYVRAMTPVAKSLVYFHYVFNKSISNAIYLITMGGNLKIIVDHYYSVDVNIVSTITVFMVLLLAMALIRNLKFLVPMSVLTNVFSIVNVILILTIPMDYNGSADLKAVTDITKFPNFFGLALGAFNCTGLIVPLKNDMKHPKKFTRFFGVINIALFAAGILYCSFGTLGYAKFGDRVQPNVLFNLPPEQAISLVVLFLYSFVICISFILTLYTVFDTIWSNVFKDQKMNHPLTIEYALRIVVCILPYVIAIALPDFKIMVSLAGVLATLMDETLPIILHFLSVIQNKPKSINMYLMLMKDLVLILLCSLVFSASLIDVVRSIIKFYSSVRLN